MQKPMTALGPWPALGYVDSIIERAAERRTDLDFLSARAADANCGFYLVGGEMVVLKATGDLHDPVFSSDEIASLRDRPGPHLSGRCSRMPAVSDCRLRRMRSRR